jgi:uncharacterized protein YndB with AHSA1/START domain
MTNNTVNETERMVVTRVFDAPRELVWKAWTRSAHRRRSLHTDCCQQVTLKSAFAANLAGSEALALRQG